MPGFLGKLLYLVIVVAGGWLLTTRGIPWLVIRAGRLLRFQMKLTPISTKRISRFKRIRRGYWSFLAISTLFVISLFLELIVNEKPLAIHYDGRTAFPAIADWLDHTLFFASISSFQKKSDFGQAGASEVDYRLFARTLADPSFLDPQIAEIEAKLAKARTRFERIAKPGPGDSEFKRSRYAQRQKTLEKRRQQLEKLERGKKIFVSSRAWILPTLYPYSPSSLRLDLAKNPPNPPSLDQTIPLGTTMSGRDVLVLLLYGFRISLAFALLVAACGYAFGVIVGGIQGYYGGWVDILTQRFVEIWGSIPFLFTIMILASLVTPSFVVLMVFMIVLRSWLGITYYVRGEFYREKAKDYVHAAVGAGVSDWKIITGHILPNSLVPVVTFAPFGIVAYIVSLVSLDYLGFGLPPGTPSWGALLRQGLENVRFYPHLVIVPVTALATTLFAVVMVGEAVREAFDPKVFSRLR
ncbi:MAG: ABC transporter permease subunit [Planctomycetota bacterium]